MRLCCVFIYLSISYDLLRAHLVMTAIVAAVFRRATIEATPTLITCSTLIIPKRELRGKHFDRPCSSKPGAGDGDRTRDFLLGKEMLYH